MTSGISGDCRWGRRRLTRATMALTWWLIFWLRLNTICRSRPARDQAPVKARAKVSRGFPPGSLFQIVLCHVGGELLEERRRNQLINGYLFLLRQLNNPLVNSVGQLYAHDRHDLSPIKLRNSPGVTTATPNVSAPLKCLRLWVIMQSDWDSTASSRTKSSLASGSVGRQRK